MSTHKKDLLYIPAILLITGILVYLETNLTSFQKFLPVVDNKLLIGILNVNFLLILLLIFLASRILFKTYVEKKRGIWGSRLKTRLTLTVFSISIISSASLFILTTWFLFVSMDKWFSQEIEDTVENARGCRPFTTRTFSAAISRWGICSHRPSGTKTCWKVTRSSPSS